jgi:hypothetical protein
VVFLSGRAVCGVSAAGDPLEKLGVLIDFEIFRPALDAALQRSDGSKGGRPPLDAVMMFKTLILQTLYGLSDAQAEFQILDRRSFGASSASTMAITRPPRRRSGGSARPWCVPRPSMPCLPGSTPTSKVWAIWPWGDRSSTPASSPLRVNA